MSCCFYLPNGSWIHPLLRCQGPEQQPSAQTPLHQPPLPTPRSHAGSYYSQGYTSSHKKPVRRTLITSLSGLKTLVACIQLPNCRVKRKPALKPTRPRRPCPTWLFLAGQLAAPCSALSPHQPPHPISSPPACLPTCSAFLYPLFLVIWQGCLNRFFLREAASDLPH